MMAMVIFGFGEMIGCFFTGFIVDKKGSKFASIFDTLSIIVTVSVTLWFLGQREFKPLFAYMMTFMWGF